MGVAIVRGLVRLSVLLVTLGTVFSVASCRHSRNKAPAVHNLSEIQSRSAAILGAGDVVEIRVYPEKELTGKYRISSAGTVVLPLIGEIKISGKSPEEAAADIQAKYQNGYLRIAEVSVYVEEYHSRNVYVIGEVRTPGPVLFEENMTLIAAIAKAGGTSPMAAPNRTIITRTHDNMQQRIDAQVDRIGKGLPTDIRLVPGDIIFVPESVF